MKLDSANPEIALPAVAKGPGPAGQALSRRDDPFHEELSRLNPEVANLQRELARTQAELAAAQKKLEAGEQRYRSLGASLPIGIFEWDAAGRCVYTNAQWQAISGLTAEESMGDGWQRALDPRDAPAFLEERNQARQAGQEFSREVRFVSARGDQRWARFRSRAMAAEGGEAAGRVSTVEDITERRQAEDELRWKTGLLEAQVNTSIDGILVTNPQGRKILQNQRLSDLFKIPPDIADDKEDAHQVEWVAGNIASPKQFRAQVAYLYARPGEASRDEIELKDGMVLDRYTSPVSGPDGTYYGRLWAFRDVTERKRAESKLRELSRAVEQSPALVVITDPKGLIEYVNPKFCAVTGYRPEEVFSKNCRFLKSGETSREAYRQMWATIAAGEEWHGEFHNRKKNGELYWESASISAIRSEAGNITHFVAVKEDITERKALEACLEQQRAEHEIILNSIGDGVHWLDAGGRIKYENPAAAKMLGYEIEELLGRPAHATMHHTRPDGSAYPQAECPIYATLRDRVTHRVTNEVFWRKDGTSFDVEYSCTPVYERDGRSGGTVVIFADTTERKQAQAGREKLERQLAEHKLNEERSRLALEHEQRSSQVKDRFVSMVSHEFRTPLSIINMAAELLDGYLDKMTDAERSEHLDEITRSVGRMTQMMNGFLIHDNCANGKIECKPARLKVEALCRRLTLATPDCSDPDRTIECVVDPAVGEAWLDEKILGHILGNLLGNAVKYSLAGQRVKLEVKRVAGGPQPKGGTAAEAEPHLEFKVSDSGIGIPAADLAKLGQTFHRAANVGNRPGTGMGLAIVKQFVDRLGGRFRLESEEGKGTTVWVALPIASPAAPAGR